MKICVYTAVFDDFDNVLPPKGTHNDIDFIAYTDEKTSIPQPWEKRLYSGPAGLSARLRNRYLKINGPKLLPQYDASIWVDGNVRPSGNLALLVDEFLNAGRPLALVKHFKRHSVEDEADACIRMVKISDVEVATLNEQVSGYLAEGFPDNRLFECNVMFRLHQNTDVQNAMELWWNEVSTKCVRDQVSLPYVLWKIGLDPHVWQWSTRSSGSPFPAHRHKHPTSKLRNAVQRISAMKNDSLRLKASYLALFALTGGRIKRW